MKTTTLLLLTLLLASCASDVVSIHNREVPSRSELLNSPVATQEPQLKFCLTFEGDKSKMKDKVFHKKLIDGFIKENPYTNILYIDPEATYSCHVVLAVQIYNFSENFYGSVRTMTEGSEKGSLFYAYTRMKESFEEVAHTLGRYTFNAFSPGSKLYSLIKEKGLINHIGFEDIVKEYREKTPKPELNEEARKYKIQAESAVKRKEFDVAAARYAEALTIAPWWPQGHFNRALILGETEKYQSAIDEMNKYLLLVPEAPDARSARDKIYEWEDLAKRKK